MTSGLYSNFTLGGKAAAISSFQMVLLENSTSGWKFQEDIELYTLPNIQNCQSAYIDGTKMAVAVGIVWVSGNSLCMYCVLCETVNA